MYRIKLYHTIFDKENDNVLLFNSKEELKEYFENQDFQLFENINFIANNLIETNICLTIDTDKSIPLIKILNYNYCMVENMENEEDTLYFFINESKQDSANQIILSLQLDPFNSYYYDIRNLRGLVNRTHLDRYVKRDENYVFNFAEASPLFEREPIQNLSKRPTYKSKLIPILAGEGTDFDNWINENVDHWVYYYISGGKEYKAYKSHGESEIEPKTFLSNIKFTYNSGFGLDGAVVVLVAPVYKTDKRFLIRGEVDQTSHTYFYWEETSIKEFLDNNDGFANVYAIKHSILPPFYATNVLNQKTEVLSNGNLRYNAVMPGSSGDAYISGTTGFDYILDYCVGFAKSSGGFATEPRAFGFVERQYVEKYLTLKPNYRGKLLPELYKNTFSIDELIYNGNLEPKIYNEDYSTYRLYIGGQSKDFPISKTSSQPKFRYFEILSPDITKAFLTFDAYESYTPYASVFNDVTVKDFTGFMINIDLSMWFSKDGLDNWLATNKNNIQIFSNNIMSSYLQRMVSMFGGVASSAGQYNAQVEAWSPTAKSQPTTGGIIGSAISGIASGINTIIENSYATQNFNLTLDNMRNAPEELSALNSNLVLISNVDEFGIYIEIQEPLSFEREKIVDYLKLFGYSYNKIGDVRDFNKTRRYYNYVQAMIFEIDGEIAEQVKDYLKSIFAKGIRFWHADQFQSIDFTLNNIERSIYNG